MGEDSHLEADYEDRCSQGYEEVAEEDLAGEQVDPEPSCVQDVLDFLSDLEHEAQDHLDGTLDVHAKMDWDARLFRARDLRERLAWVWGA